VLLLCGMLRLTQNTTVFKLANSWDGMETVLMSEKHLQSCNPIFYRPGSLHFALTNKTIMAPYGAHIAAMEAGLPAEAHFILPPPRKTTAAPP
jgi:hypothetical protein